MASPSVSWPTGYTTYEP